MLPPRAAHRLQGAAGNANRRGEDIFQPTGPTPDQRAPDQRAPDRGKGRAAMTDAPFLLTPGKGAAVDAPQLTPDELATLATRALKRPETISPDEIRILAASVLVEATGQAA